MSEIVVIVHEGGWTCPTVARSTKALPSGLLKAGISREPNQSMLDTIGSFFDPSSYVEAGKGCCYGFCLDNAVLHDGWKWSEFRNIGLG